MSVAFQAEHGQTGTADSPRSHAEGESEPVWLEVAALRGGHSPRLGGVNPAYVRQLAELTHELPPLVVQRGALKVVDGMHRLEAARARGDRMVHVVYFDGTDDEAFIAAVRLNGSHGRPLAPRERAGAAERVLASHPELSNRWIAALCGVAPKTVAGLRSRSSDDGARLNTRLGRDGRRRPLKAAEGRQVAADILAREPDTSLREVARQAEISLGTASDVRRLLAAELAAPHAAARVPGARTSLAPALVSAPALASAPAPVSAPVLSDAKPAVTYGRSPSRPDSPELAAARNRLDVLQRDPSLHYSEGGRMLLQLAFATLGFLDRPGKPAAAPNHCRDALREVALACADGWRDFAVRLGAE